MTDRVRSLFVFGVWCGLLACVGCSDNSSTGAALADGGALAAGGAGGGGAGATDSSGVFTAVIDGTSWSAAPKMRHARVVAKIPGGYSLEGTDAMGIAAHSLTLALYNVASPGDYPFGVTASVVGAYASYSQTDGRTWHTRLIGNAGTLSVTTLSAQRIAGTFELDLVPFPGTQATGNRALTNGQFDLPIEGTVTPVAANVGRIVRAQINGAAFNAASVVVTPIANGLSFNALNDQFNIGFSFAGVSGPGTYDLSLSSPLRAVVVVAGSKGDPKTDCCWGNLQSDTGTVQLTTFSSDRLIGTFELTLQPQSNSIASAPLVVTHGEFDIGRK